MPLVLILAECGVELIPKEIRNEPSIKKQIKDDNYPSQLLDTALHHSSMKSLEDYQKRGRPDILHLCLLNALGSPLNKHKNLKVFFHTASNDIFEVHPEIRIARNYNRFKGLMGKLLIEGEISADGKKLISKFDGNLDDLIKSFKKPEIMILSSIGELIKTPKELFISDSSKNYIAFVGGFQKGGFSEDILALAEDTISISKFPLDAWVVVNKVINLYELNLELF